MKQLQINEQEVLEGLVLANRHILSLQDNMIISNTLAAAQRVTLVAMSASGSEPCIAGFVGQGLLDIAVIGNAKAAPGPAQVFKAIQLADRGQGVLLVVLNNAGDILTSNIVLKQAAKLGIKISRVILQDELLPNPETTSDNTAPLKDLCQGLVGILPVLKIAGAAAAVGMPLNELTALAQACADNTVTASIGLADLAEAISAEDLAAAVIPQIEDALKPGAEEPLLVIVNGNGVASLAEQLALYRSCFAELTGKGFSVAASAVNDYYTGQANIFANICIAKLSDQLLQLWNAGCKAPYFSK